MGQLGRSLGKQGGLQVEVDELGLAEAALPQPHMGRIDAKVALDYGTPLPGFAFDPLFHHNWRSQMNADDTPAIAIVRRFVGGLAVVLQINAAPSGLLT
ncbi:MAG: hypothetical protein ACKO7W_16855 [Elainella sp.]